MKQHGISAYSGLRSITLLLFALILFFSASAQAPQKNYDKPHDLKVISEKIENGYLVRTVEYREAGMLVTETIFMPRVKMQDLHNPINPDTLNKDSVMIMVDKSHYIVHVYYKKQLVRNYKAVFGPHPLQNKCMEGDRCTPEGWFKIASKNANSRYDRFMGLSYPSDSDIIRFNKMKQKGQIPATARIGNSVGIHGIWPGGDDMIEMGVGWTDGCIALKNRDIEELFKFVGVGTKVYIKK